MRHEHPFAKRSLGQNFLVDEGVIQNIVEAFAPTKSDAVLEIGPGRGALTAQLVERAERVYALEFDRHLARVLAERFAGRDSFALIEDDALHIDFAAIERDGRKLRLIANLPYNISTAILQRLFEYTDTFEDCVLMFQREVVDRITAAPGTKDRGYLTVLVEAYFQVERIFDVAPDAFRPAPKVWSSVVRLVPKTEVIPNASAFQSLLAAGFAQKRKTILNNLKIKYPDSEGLLLNSGIDPGRRAETLSLEEWQRLADAIGENTQG